MRRAMIAMLIGVGVLWHATAEAQVKYVDEAGVSHWVASPEQVPAKYRNKTEQPTLPPVHRTESVIKRLDLEERRLNADVAIKNTQRPIVPDTPAMPSQVSDGDFQRASGVCQASVNRGQRGRVFGSGTFKAQADTDGTVNTVGTDQARFEYNKCMADQGHPLRPVR